MSASKRYALWVPCVALALMGALFLFSCKGEGLLGSDGNLDSSVSADSDLRDNPGQPRENTPQVLDPEQPGSLLMGDSSTVILDYSNSSLGYISAKSFLGDTIVKVLVDAPDGREYQYTVALDGSYTTIPLTRGNGTYQVGVYENLYKDQYAGLFSLNLAVELSDEFGPFLYPNPYVEFTEGDETVQLSKAITENATSDVEAVEQIYLYVVQNISYDYDKAETVAPGYLPNNEDTLRTKTGICFDFASLTASMMRAQRLPTKLDVGYCGDAYHAWIEVYTKEKGWIRKKIEFPGNAYVRMDPTFDSAGKGRGDIDKIIGDGTHYSPMLYY